MPCFANTYFVKPEQSNPLCGVLPPHEYGTPTYRSAVPSTRDAVADGAGEAGKRALPERDVEVGRESDDVVREPSTSPARITVESTVDGDIEIMPWAHPSRSSVQARTRAGRAGARGITPFHKAPLAPTGGFTTIR